ncbi:carboxylesterase/lipase family protein [Bordetella bronchialis]|uniref:carboxylesterase/lipase family protein n=1 Tax=Bordetella bronchialis TaxID=463025 RepID=UPI003D0057C6
MNDASASMPEVATRAGTLRGRVENGIAVFRGIPYAAPPVGELRFEPPRDHAGWSGVRDALQDGPIAPQGRSRLAHVMGDFERPQSEDCLTLNLWTPRADGRGRPVMVWLHGGAYSSGAGSLPWYAGDRFAANGDVVFVSVNYRLGALGFLYLPGVSEGNMGLLDQMQALRWIRDNISAFGGDPGNVTVVGQSAGGGSIAAMMTMPAAKGLFHRAILQSPGMGRPSRGAAEAAELGARYAHFAGVEPGDERALKQAPVAKLLAAQGELARSLQGFAVLSLPFSPVRDGRIIEGNIVERLQGGAGAGVDVMVGTTREEMAAFHCVDQAVLNADEAAARQVFERICGPDYPAYYDEFRRLRAVPSPAAMLGDLTTDQVFRMGSLRLAEGQAKAGRPAYVYQFDWQSPVVGFKSCHCLDIPFVFNNRDNWRDSPMLQGADEAEFQGVAHAMHYAWIAFARGGDPNHDGLPHWAPYDTAQRTTMRFDTVIGPVNDLAGLSYRLPWPAI